MVNHGLPWWSMVKQPWSTMVDHGRPCFVKWPPMVNHGLINTMSNHGRPWSRTMVDHGQTPWLTMVKTTEKNKKVKFSIKRKSLLFHGMPILTCKFYFMQYLYNAFIDMQCI